MKIKKYLNVEKSLETAKENPKKVLHFARNDLHTTKASKKVKQVATEMAKMAALQLPVETGQSKPRQPEKPEEPSFLSAQAR